MYTKIGDLEISTISRMQRFTYRCLEMFGPKGQSKSIDQKRTLMDVWASKLFDGMDYNITFDESVWTPIEPEMYGNVVQLSVRPLMGLDVKIIRIDFRDAWHEIFNVEYVSGEVEE